jgi:hypothetical protein
MMIYCATKFKPKKKRKLTGEIARKYKPSTKLTGVYELPRLEYRTDASKSIASLDTDAFSVARKESLKYTGTLVKGIATMHKSNAVPVIDQEQMKDISRMRRG